MAVENPFAKLHAAILAQPAKPADPNEQRRAEALARQRVHELRRSLGPRYADCSLDNFRVSQDPEERNDQQTVLGQVQAFVDELPDAVKCGSGLFLSGPIGTGKDHLLAAVMLAAVRQGYAVTWINGLDIFAAARDAITEEVAEAQLFDRLTRPTILGISDPLPPTGVATPSQRSLLFRAIDFRYRFRKPTWITANIANREDAELRLGAQLIDRLTDGALCLACNWPSYRLSRRWKPSN